MKLQLMFMPRKKPCMLGVGSAVLVKCRELWRGLTGGGFAVARRHADDYFRGSYEFSCTATPINFPPRATNGRGRRRRRLPPCVGGKQAQEMLECIAPGKGWSPERSPGAGAGNEIDGLAEEFIRRFYDQLRMQRVEEIQVESGSGSGGGGDRVVDCGVCAICLDKIALQETALVKGCDHAYCVTCILRWASYKQTPQCPQCKHPFEFLSVHRSLDGCLHDYLFEESVCLLLRAAWFEPLIVEAHEEAPEEDEIYLQYQYDDDEDDLDEESYYMSRSPSIRIGNRRWGDNGYIRGGRREARPVNADAAGPSRTPKKKERAASTSGSGSGSVSKDASGRRAKRAQKREAADKAAAEKHLKHLQRMGLVKAPAPEVPAEVGPQVNE